MAGYNGSVGFALEKKTSSLPTISAGVGVAGAPNRVTITTSAPHNIRVGDKVTTVAGTTAGYGATRTVTAVTSTTFTMATGTTLLATAAGTMPTISAVTQVGVAKAVNRFLEFLSFTLKGKPQRLYGGAMGAGRLFKRRDRVVPYMGALTGDWSLECLDEGMLPIFLLAMGAIATTGPTDEAYEHTITAAKLWGMAATFQVNKPDDLDTDYIETYFGTKVITLKVELAVNQLVKITATLDAMGVATDVPLAVASYSTTAELLSFFGGTLTMDGTDFPNVTQMTIEINNNLVTARRHLGQANFSEQADKGQREIKITATAEFRGTALVDKVKATIPADAMADVSITLEGSTPIGAGSTLPTITFDTPNLVIEDGTPDLSGPDLLILNLTGQGLDSDMTADDALTITVVTADSAP